MTIDTRIAPVAGDTSLSIQWSAIIAGAIGAAALAFVLHAFATAIGISLSSTAPTWRDASFALVFLSGLYLVLTALASYSFGAYIAARLRVPFTGAPADAEFRDGMQADDRTYLVRLVMATTGLAQPDAERRVDDVAARSRDDLNRARRSAVILGFMVGAAALVGAVAAWYAACAAGRHRDGREALDPFWDWGRPVTRLY